MTAYEPRPGTVPFRAIAHLQTLPRGAEVATASLAMESGAKAGYFTAIMEHARDAGAVFARQKGGHPKSPYFWSLVDHAKTDAAAPKPSKLTAAALEPIVAEMPRTGRARLAPTNLPEGRDSQQVLKAEGASPDATDREIPAMASPGVGPMGAGQPADAGPDGDQFLPPGAMRKPPAARTNTERRYRDEGFLVGGFGPALRPAEPAVETITLTVRVANLHQAERVMQLVREMAGEGA